MSSTAAAAAATRAHARLLEAYERHLSANRGLAPATVRNYLADLSPFVEYLDRQGVGLGADARDLRRFVERDCHADAEYRALVRDYVSWLMQERRIRSGRRAGARGHQRGSVVRTLAALRTFIRYLIEQKRLPDSPMWGPGSTLMRRFSPKPAQRLPDVISSAEAVRLVEAPARGTAELGPLQWAARLRDRALLELLYGGGLRVSEITGLDTGDVSIKGRTARLWGKGSKARSVPLGAPAADALSVYAREGRPRLARSPRGSALFLNQHGGRITQRSVQTLVRRYAAAADIHDGVHTHTLRHSYATHLLDGGADLRVVQELLGHSTPSATQVYTHVSQTEARRVYLAAHPLARERDRDGQDPVAY